MYVKNQTPERQRQQRHQQRQNHRARRQNAKVMACAMMTTTFKHALGMVATVVVQKVRISTSCASFASAWIPGIHHRVIKLAAGHHSKEMACVMTQTTTAAVAGMVVIAVERTRTSTNIVQRVDVPTLQKILQMDDVKKSKNAEMLSLKEMGFAMMKTITAVVNLMVAIAAENRIKKDNSTIAKSASAKYQMVMYVCMFCTLQINAGLDCLFF